MKIVAGARNDGRAIFLFDVVVKRTGEKFKHPKSGISRLNAYEDLERQKGAVWSIKWKPSR
jgi:hypothetical protein